MMLPTFRKPGPLRWVYWVVMLAAIGALLWYIRGTLLPYYELQK